MERCQVERDKLAHLHNDCFFSLAHGANRKSIKDSVTLYCGIKVSLKE